MDVETHDRVIKFLEIAAQTYPWPCYMPMSLQPTELQVPLDDTGEKAKWNPS